MHSTQQLRVVLFEDDQAFSDLLRKVMQGFGHHVLAFPAPTACPVYLGLGAQCPKEFPCADVLITDNMMPKMSGIEFLQLQRERGCKVLDKNKALMTAALTIKQQRRVEELGCHYFKKPFKISSLKKWLDECAGRVPEGQVLAQL